MFVEYLCNRNPKIKPKNLQKLRFNFNYCYYQNWLDASFPLCQNVVIVACQEMGDIAVPQNTF